ncbi:hypothetical protein Dimus_015343, partial [Dionaea muscipula]
MCTPGTTVEACRMTERVAGREQGASADHQPTTTCSPAPAMHGARRCGPAALRLSRRASRRDRSGTLHWFARLGSHAGRRLGCMPVTSPRCSPVALVFLQLILLLA